jgi:hypothetical protein
MSKRTPTSRTAIPMLPQYANEIPDREETSSPPASAYLSPEGRRLATVPEEDVAQQFSFSTTLRRHRRRTSDGELEISDFVMSPGLGPVEKLRAFTSYLSVWWANHTGSPSQPNEPQNGVKEEIESPSEKFCSMSIEVSYVSYLLVALHLNRTRKRCLLSTHHRILACRHPPSAS